MNRRNMLILLVLTGALFYSRYDAVRANSAVTAKAPTVVVPAPAQSPINGAPPQRQLWLAQTFHDHSPHCDYRRRGESIDDYAHRIGVERRLKVELGGGVSVEMELIPSGDFEMGAHRPDPPNASRTSALDSELLIGIGGSLLISLIIIPLGRAWRLRQRPSFSLRWLMVLMLGMSLISWGSARLIQDPWIAYRSELKRYNKLPDGEIPAHYEYISDPFYMSKFKVTQEQADKVWNQPHRFPGKLRPAETASFDDAVTFCSMLNVVVSMKYAEFRIPTEKEWEFACRAETLTNYYSGNSETDLADVAWYKRNSQETTHPVGQKSPNAFGLYDMHGNLPEWCAGNNSRGVGPTSHIPVIRGSSWQSEASDCRVSRVEPEYSKLYDHVGLRLVLPCSVGTVSKAAELPRSVRAFSKPDVVDE